MLIIQRLEWEVLFCTLSAIIILFIFLTFQCFIKRGVDLVTFDVVLKIAQFALECSHTLTYLFVTSSTRVESIFSIAWRRLNKEAHTNNILK